MYKFLREVDGGIKSDSGDCSWQIGKWKKLGLLKTPKLCNSGFHCSEKIYQAFSYVQGEILAEVEGAGKCDKSDDKLAYSQMKIVRAWKWQKKDSVALSIFAAELCIENFEKWDKKDKRPREAIEAAKRWLENPTKENESAAWSAESAARSAARSAWSAESAARSAESAWSAARSAAWSAARSAESAAWSAESAAWSAESAARSAIVQKISDWMDERLKVLEPLE